MSKEIEKEALDSKERGCVSFKIREEWGASIVHRIIDTEKRKKNIHESVLCLIHFLRFYFCHG